MRSWIRIPLQAPFYKEDILLVRQEVIYSLHQEGYIMSRKRKKRNICEVHDEIRELAEKLEETLVGEVPKKHLKVLEKIQTLAEEAKEYGQSMENRMSEYRDAIEGVGFNRCK